MRNDENAVEKKKLTEVLEDSGESILGMRLLYSSHMPPGRWDVRMLTPEERISLKKRGNG